VKLELCSYPVHEVVLGGETAYRDGVLSIDRDQMLRDIRQDGRITSAEIELVRPGDSVRVTTVRDAIEPRIKAEGPGQTYPGFCGRPVTLVGRGRTNRLDGVAVLEVADVWRYDGDYGWVHDGFLDMSEPGRHASPLGSLTNVCVVLEADRTLPTQAGNEAVHAAALLVQDRLAATTLGQEPASRETFVVDPLTPVDPALPRLVHIMGLHSPQHYSNSLTAYGTGIYGMTRLTPPWLLHPTELLDGAVSFGASWLLANTWQLVNNPVVLGLLRRHGREVNFLGVIAIRTRWSAQHEKDLICEQAAKLAHQLGAQGAVVTYDATGNDFLEVIRSVEACERIGVRTVLITGEEPPAHGGPPLLDPIPEADAIVSLGTGGVLVENRRVLSEHTLPPVARVIGAPEIVGHTGTRAGRLDARGQLPAPRPHDAYGFTRLTCIDY
jgi:hypothetical protein